eukprot:5067028-Alexandrium_andersonii.AAC.1
MLSVIAGGRAAQPAGPPQPAPSRRSAPSAAANGGVGSSQDPALAGLAQSLNMFGSGSSDSDESTFDLGARLLRNQKGPAAAVAGLA